MPNVEAVIAKHNAATAEPAPDVSSAPPAGASVAGSAVADVETPAGAGELASPTAIDDGAAVDRDELQAKLVADRARTRAKQLRRQAKADSEAAAKAKADADAELARWKALGKDQSFLDAIKAAGHDPRQVYEQMRQEALKAGTPEARIEALEKKHAAELEAIRAELKKRDDEAAEREEKAKAAEKAAAEARHAQMFEADFRKALGVKEFAPLLEEYEPEQLFGLATKLFREPRTLFEHAKSLKVNLTARDGTFTMQDIFQVMRAMQAAHHARMQRRTQGAAPQTRDAPVTQEPEANTTVNGTAERKAGPPTTIGNDIATSHASTRSDKELRASMTRDEWRAYVRKKYEHV